MRSSMVPRDRARGASRRRRDHNRGPRSRPGSAASSFRCSTSSFAHRKRRAQGLGLAVVRAIVEAARRPDRRRERAGRRGAVPHRVTCPLRRRSAQRSTPHPWSVQGRFVTTILSSMTTSACAGSAHHARGSRYSSPRRLGAEAIDGGRQVQPSLILLDSPARWRRARRGSRAPGGPSPADHRAVGPGPGGRQGHRTRRRRDDYLTKPFGASELLARIRVALRRVGAAPRRNLIQVGPIRSISRHLVTVDGREIHLTRSSSACSWNWPVNRAACSPQKALTRSGDRMRSTSCTMSACTWLRCAQARG